MKPKETASQQILKRIYISLFLLFALTNQAAVSPEISFTWEGGLSNYGRVGVEIDASGKVYVHITQRPDKTKSYTTVLNEPETAQLNLILRDADLFNQAVGETNSPRTDVGRTTMTVKTASAQKQISYAFQPQLRPLEEFLWKCVTQGDFANDFEGGRMYELLGGIDPRHASRKVLQPYVFKEPLAKSLKTLTNDQQIAWRLQALSCITTPAEFVYMITPCLNNTNTVIRKLWLTTLFAPYCYGNLQEDHLVALFPVYEDQVKRFGDKEVTADTREGAALVFFRRVLEEHHYTPRLSRSIESSVSTNGGFAPPKNSGEIRGAGH